MKQIKPSELPVPEVHRLLLGGVGPRPIALVSSISADGKPNLSPFSFFNVFGANPPVLAFSPSRRGRDATLKDTFLNISETRECVVQAVTFDMVEQINLASTEYPHGVDEFETSGLTPLASVLVKPARVKESPFQMECKVLDIKSYGNGGASANLIICEIILIHVSEDLFVNGIIHPDKIDLVARMGGEFYSRAAGGSIFEIEKPLTRIGIGYNNLPEYIKHSDQLTANDIAKLANFAKIPNEEEVGGFLESHKTSNASDPDIFIQSFNRALRTGDITTATNFAVESIGSSISFHASLFIRTVQTLLNKKMTHDAWCLLIAAHKAGKL